MPYSYSSLCSKSLEVEGIFQLIPADFKDTFIFKERGKSAEKQGSGQLSYIKVVNVIYIS